MRATAPITVQTKNVHVISVTDRDRTTGHLGRDLMTEADIGMAKQIEAKIYWADLAPVSPA